MSVFRAKKLEIVNFLEPFVPQLLVHLQLYNVISRQECEIVGSAVGGNKGILMSLLEVLESKDSALAALMLFLRKNDMSSFADTLAECADKFSLETESSGGGLLDQFLTKLAKYYERSSNVWIPSNSSKPVSKVYVALSLREEGKSEHEVVKTDTMLKRLREDDRISVGLIKGDPGTGKTTMMTQLALDWADKYLHGKGKENVFSVVLHVPLKSAPAKCDDILAMAVEYLLKTAVRMRSVSDTSLLKLIDDMESNVVVLLDGLDEYNTANTEIGNIFAPKFDTTAENVDGPPPFPYKLIAATRPYACRVVNPKVQMAKYNVVPLNSEERLVFAKAYCARENTLAKVSAYLSHVESAVLPVQVPLVLLLVCYLAEYEEAIPSSHTRLYERCLYHMMRRAVKVRAEKLDEGFVLFNTEFEWTYTNVARKTSELAVVCCHRDLSTIEQQLLRQLAVPNDSFACGYLLYRFDAVSDSFIAHFPHRSIQEFFAALNCYNLILGGIVADANHLLRELILRYDEVSVFLLGIASCRGTFQDVANSVMTTASVLDTTQLCLILSQNKLNPDIHKEEFQRLNELFGRQLYKMHSSEYLSSVVALYECPAISQAMMLLLRYLTSRSDSEAQEFIAVSPDTLSTNLKDAVNAFCRTNGIIGENGIPEAIIFDICNQLPQLMDNKFVFFWRITAESVEVYVSTLDCPRVARIAGSVGPISNIWKEQLDSTHTFVWYVDQLEFLARPDALIGLPNELGLLIVSIAPSEPSSDHQLSKVVRIQYRNQHPKQLKLFILLFDNLLLLSEAIRTVELHPSLNWRSISNDDFLIDVAAECDRTQLVLNIIRLSVESTCGPTLVKDDLD